MLWLVPFIVGWWGTVWWPGIEVDAPPPGGGDWWWRWVVGILGGIGAVVVLGQVPTITDSLSSIFVALATGGVVRAIVSPVGAMVRGGAKA